MAVGSADGFSNGLVLFSSASHSYCGSLFCYSPGCHLGVFQSSSVLVVFNKSSPLIGHRDKAKKNMTKCFLHYCVKINKKKNLSFILHVQLNLNLDQYFCVNN